MDELFPAPEAPALAPEADSTATGLLPLESAGGSPLVGPSETVARVLLDQALDRPLDYRIPSAWQTQIGIGTRVRVPLQNRTLLGTVVALVDSAEAARCREIAAVLGERPALGPVLLRLARWMADYYLCREEVALRAVLPQVVRAAKLGPLQRKAVALAKTPTTTDLERLARKAPRQAALLEELQARPEDGPVAVVELEKSLRGAGAAVNALVKAGWLTLSEIVTPRDPCAEDSFLPSEPLPLSEAQAVCLQAVGQAIAAPRQARPLLLHGVTGSGKTEVYLQAVSQALELGRTALILVPEIALAPQTVERFKSRFSERQDEIAVLHSHLSEGERHDEWHKIHSGRARIVIGARSAIFAPLENLGLIVVDEEHESSYKQDEMPKYHARDIAVLRASFEPCAVVLGSATTSAESYHNVQSGKYELIELPERADNRCLPIIRILDLKLQRRKSGPGSILTVPLMQAITERLARQEQVLLFLNRRGYSTSLVCQACGHVCECPDCSVPLTYHRDAERLICHICGFSQRAPKDCPSCHDAGIRFTGMGTQKIEEAVQQAFPTARIVRMDADTMGRKDAYRDTFRKFRARQIDILVGTQMIAKGLHFPNVTLVGIINADVGLHLPDFRAGERTFQLLTQVAGRAGRGEMEGEVLVQSATPSHSAIQYARHHDFAGFWEQEREFRQVFQFPPFTRMMLLTVRGAAEDLAEFTANTLHRRLAEGLPEGVRLGEVAPAPLMKAKGQYRFQISLRSPKNPVLHQHVRAVLQRFTLPEEVHLSIDVDPYHLL